MSNTVEILIPFQGLFETDRQAVSQSVSLVSQSVCFWPCATRCITWSSIWNALGVDFSYNKSINLSYFFSPPFSSLSSRLFFPSLSAQPKLLTLSLIDIEIAMRLPSFILRRCLWLFQQPFWDAETMNWFVGAVVESKRHIQYRFDLRPDRAQRMRTVSRFNRKTTTVAVSMAVTPIFPEAHVESQKQRH